MTMCGGRKGGERSRHEHLGAACLMASSAWCQGLWGWSVTCRCTGFCPSLCGAGLAHLLAAAPFCCLPARLPACLGSNPPPPLAPSLLLVRHLPQHFWGGGTVSLATSSDNFHVLKCRPADKLEDGTVNFLDIIALKVGVLHCGGCRRVCMGSAG